MRSACERALQVAKLIESFVQVSTTHTQHAQDRSRVDQVVTLHAKQGRQPAADTSDRLRDLQMLMQRIYIQQRMKFKRIIQGLVCCATSISVDM